MSHIYAFKFRDGSSTQTKPLEWPITQVIEQVCRIMNQTLYDVISVREIE